MVTGANLDICPLSGDAFTIALTVTATPLSRGYLYLRRNAFFDDSVDFSVGADGMLSNSDTSSTQEITAILTEVAETASAVATGGLKFVAAKVNPDVLLSDDDKKTIDQLKKDTPQEAADFLSKLSTADLTHILETLPLDDRAVVLKKLPATATGPLLKKLAPEDLAWVVGRLPSADAFSVLGNLFPADLGEILNKWRPGDMTALAENLTLRKLKELLQKLTLTDRTKVSATFATIFTDINTQSRLEEKKKLELQKRPACFKAVADIVKTVPFYDTVAFDEVKGNIDPEGSQLEFGLGPWPYRSVPKGLTPKDSTITWMIPITVADEKSRDGVSISFSLQTRINSYDQAVKPGKETLSFGGFVAFFPVPATGKNECVVTRIIDQLPTDATPITSKFLLSPPAVVNLYTESHFLNPQRDFLTNPHDTFTFTSGLITGHKFTGQSAAKTVVDTITSPIRALMPSVTVTQSVAVSPTGKTTTTSTQTAPPKGP